MNKTIGVTAVITALVVFLITLAIVPTQYQGYDAKHWFDEYSKAEYLRNADYNAISCVRRLGYTNLPYLRSTYTFEYPENLDSAGNYYAKNQVDNCFLGL
jgi:hypothetical protein